MKNIHILPTDKSSRIYLIKSNNKLGITSNNPEFTKKFGSGTQNQNIYITSDEEIKDGDWYYDLDLNKLHQFMHSIGVTFNTLKKIILTTDQDLIKDGVQAIDDKFLEWFVKNPSCEKVEILRCPIEGLYTIIPKEQPKQEKIYSEKEVLKLLKDYNEHTLKLQALKLGNSFNVEDWLEQFKKK